MTSVLPMRSHRLVPARTREAAAAGPWWRWLSVPIALLGTGGSLAGILLDRPYREETDNWAAQAVGQDIANLAVFAVMLAAAYAASRGSLRGHLVWLGTTVYAAYTYAIYAFAVHFNPLFLLYVAVLGMSVWALVGGLAATQPRAVRAAYLRTPGAAFAAVLLLVLAIGFAFLWLAQDLPAMVDGTPSTELRDTGLLTNPVHVLDLSLFLPSAALAGVLLLRRRPWGYVLAPVVLVAMAAISAGIVAVVVVSVARDVGGSLVVAAVIGVVGLVQVLAAGRLLGGLEPGASSPGLLRGHSDSP